MVDTRVGTITLEGEDANRFLRSLLHPSDEEIATRDALFEQIDRNVTIIERANGFDAIITDLDLSFLDEKKPREVYSMNVPMDIRMYGSVSSTGNT